LTIETGGVIGIRRDRSRQGRPVFPGDCRARMNSPRAALPAVQSIHDTVCSHAASGAGEGDRLGLQPRPAGQAKLQLRLGNDAGKAQAANGRGKKVGVPIRSAVDRLAAAAQQPQPADMLAEGTDDMMVLAMYVVGDRAAHGDELGTGHDRQAPAARHHQPLDVAQHHAGLAN
jgi:hypothetical protein